VAQAIRQTFGSPWKLADDRVIARRSLMYLAAYVNSMAYTDGDLDNCWQTVLFIDIFRDTQHWSG
jgi:hypothetical protein